MANTSLLGSFGGQGGDALMFRNKVINGDMVIDQRNNGASVANANGYVVDRFFNGYFGGTTGRFSAQRSTTAPAGFTNSLLLTTTTAQASLAANDGLGIIQHIEGFNVSDLAFGTANAQAVTVSFWIRSSQTGTLGVMLTNGAANRTYGALITINSANTFEYKTVTIPGDTTGTWSTNNTTGISLFIGLGGGASRTVSAGWSAGLGGSNPGAVSGQTINLVAVNGATLYLTGVQLEAGPTATPFERRPIGVELQMCQRYCYQMNFSGATATNLICVGTSTSGGRGNVRVLFPVTMRGNPVYTSVPGASGFLPANDTVFTAFTSTSSYSTTVNGASITMTGAGSGFLNGVAAVLETNTTNYMRFDAEL